MAECRDGMRPKDACQGSGCHLNHETLEPCGRTDKLEMKEKTVSGQTMNTRRWKGRENSYLTEV